MLAIALDASERADYRFIALTHGKDATKKWKWQTADRGGMVYIGPERAAPRRQIEAPSPAAGAMSSPNEMAAFLPMGSASSFTKMTGRKVVYRSADGSYIDRYGKNVPDVDPDIDLIIKLNSPGG